MRRRPPRISFGIIVLNGEPFTRYCLRSLYPFAYEIVVVEGGSEEVKAVMTADGHFTDGTLEVLERFRDEEDPDDKVTVVTRDGFWPLKDELGHDRTAQSRAYAELATGDYLWQVDIDEFYRAADMQAVLDMLADDPSITAVSFSDLTFWGDTKYVVDFWPQARQVHRVFKWGPDYVYVTHEPPTVHDSEGRDLRAVRWISAGETAARGIHLFHYPLLFPSQVRRKTVLYNQEKLAYSRILEWAQKGYYRLDSPFHVHYASWLPSWLDRYAGGHPAEVLRMMDDVRSGRVAAETRANADVEVLLGTWWYRLCRPAVKILEYPYRAVMGVRRGVRVRSRVRKFVQRRVR